MPYGNTPQTAPGVPGSFPLPAQGEEGNSFKNNAMHPSAAAGLALGPRANPMNAGHPAMAGKK
jgi:hypothetical protein